MKWNILFSKYNIELQEEINEKWDTEYLNSY